LQHEGSNGEIGLPLGIEGKKVVVQGLGNVGYHTAKFFREHGAKVIALAEFEARYATRQAE
jgi:glutamate dehydrogenase (NAD(P)+)